jgi:V/A-type H+-transporting ATPase subunit E
MEADISIQDLLDKIKREGLEEAEKAARKILEKARAEAEEIIVRAEAEARRIVMVAEREAERKQGAFKEQMTQSGRDLILSVKQEIVKLFDRIVRREVRATLTPDVIRQMIVTLLDKWRMEELFPGVEILLSERDCAALEEGFVDKLQGQIREGVSLKPVRTIDRGFRIGERDGAVHYDLTDEAIADVLSQYLNPRVAAILKEAQEAGTG